MSDMTNRERLTYYEGDFAMCYYEADCGGDTPREIVETLAAYEDSDLTPEQVADLARAQKEGIPSALDYICAVRHYDKYGDNYTFAQTSQWFNLRFGSYEKFQEFTMQLAFLVAAARKKYEQECREEAEKAMEERTL